MATKIARRIAGVSVGVDRPGVLEPLKAAASSAADFHNWLLSQRRHGVEVDSTLLTDRNRGIVTHSKVADVIGEIVKKRACDTLFLYFSGHGVTTGGYEEKFLLSRVDRYKNETVNILTTRLDAKYCGISHVVIVYDACRSLADDASLSKLGGSSVIAAEGTAGHVDLFFACPPDDSAYEIPRTKQAFFTSVLLELLKKPPAGMLEATTIRKKSVYVIPSHRLEAFLKDEVPKRAARATPPFDQSPDIETPSYLPEFFSVVPTPKLASKLGPPGGWDPAAGGGGKGPLPYFPMAEPLRTDSELLPSGRPGSSEVVAWHAQRVFRTQQKVYVVPEELRAIEQKNGFDRAVAAMKRARGRDGFGTHTGFTIIGAKISRIALSGRSPVFELESDDLRRNVTHVRVGRPPWDVQAGTAIIELQRGGGLILAVMPGYIGTVVIQNGAIAALAYSPSVDTLLYDAYKSEESQLQDRRALAAAAAGVAKLHDLAKSEGIALAEHIRVAKGFDPCLGILAAYAYHIAGDRENVRSVYGWMSQTRVNRHGDKKEILAPVPFDVAMLAGETNRAMPPGIAPCCPMFSVGWSLLERYQIRLPAEIRIAGEYRRPGIWTAFDAEGIEHCFDALEKGQIA